MAVCCAPRYATSTRTAALVDELDADRTGIRLVNLSRSETRSLIVQAGAFGEHEFTEVGFEEEVLSYEGPQPGLRIEAERTTSRTAAAVNAKHFAVELPPSTSIRLDAGMHRLANDPSYRFPWHGGKVPAQ